MKEHIDVGEQRVFRTQLAICSCIGILAFILFCTLRFKWPHIYAVRTLRQGKESIRSLPDSYFGWITTVLLIKDEEVLQYSGLDAFVFLSFFRMGISIFWYLLLLATFIISPLRYYYTGKYDKDEIFRSVLSACFTVSKDNPVPPDLSEHFPLFLWVYPIFSYVFSIIVFRSVDKYTNYVLRIRQKYLAAQNSIVDRTIILQGIPKRLLRHKDTEVLKSFIKDLGFGDVADVKFVYDWSPLEKLFKERKKLIHSLELLYASGLGLNIDIYNKNETPRVEPAMPLEIFEHDYSSSDKLEKIRALSQRLIALDDEIREIQYSFITNTSNESFDKKYVFKKVPTAFITMESVASAQMAAQTVLDPRVHKLLVSLAPAPKDIHWENFRLTRYQKIAKSYIMTLFILLSYAALLSPISSLAILLNIKTITKFWPALGNLIKQSKWMTTFVTGILPPLLFSLFNILMPYFYKFLSECQGFSSNSDIELATLLKNFFYVFFNLFLVFTISGTVSNYWSFLSDTTKIAYDLATSLKGLSIFYIDLILLQGLALFPFRLLQVGDVWLNTVIGKIFFLKSLLLRTARDYRFYYYTPPVFDFGINLPQHILIFVIILIYSVVSTKIVASGLIYFCLGYIVYKYQLVYTSVHTPHSTGKVWTMIHRRVMLGLIIFQIFMCGTMALEGAILLSLLTTPLILCTLIVSWNYEKYYLPLIDFIALRAIQNPTNYDREFDDDEDKDEEEYNSDTHLTPELQSSFAPTEYSPLTENSPESQNLASGLNRKRSTIDEEREQYTDYTYPYLTDHLYGPWIGFEGDFISMVNYEAPSIDEAIDIEEGRESVLYAENEHPVVVRKKLKLSEWE